MNLLIGDTVANAAILEPRATAASLGDDTISFADLDAEANRVAHALLGLGLRHGDVLGWWSGTSLRSLAGFLASARIGAIFAPLSPVLSAEETAGIVDYLRPRLVAVDEERRDGARDAGAEVVTMDTDAPDDLFTLAAAASSTEVDTELADTDPHIIYLTSGSTGRPKGVSVSHRATWLRSTSGGASFGGMIRGDGGLLTSFPLYHYGGWQYVIEAWMSRTAVHLVERADAPTMMAAVERRRPSGMYCIPAVWDRVLAADGDLGCLRHAYTGTSRVGDDLLERLRHRAPNAEQAVLYGSSEAGPVAGLREWQLDAKRGSVGRPAPTGVVSFAPDGELLFRGPTLMNSYLRLPEATAAAVRDGWYYSGDIGYRDEDGFIHITGRKREVIRSGGETVAPAEVEAALRELPGVADTAVVGLPDEQWGELVCAVVVPEPGVPVPDVATLRAGLGGLANYKHPRRVVVTEVIPRTPATGQVMRSAVRESVVRESGTGSGNRSGS